MCDVHPISSCQQPTYTAAQHGWLAWVTALALLWSGPKWTVARTPSSESSRAIERVFWCELFLGARGVHTSMYVCTTEFLGHAQTPRKQVPVPATGG